MTDGSLDWLCHAAERAGVPVALAARVVPADGRADRRASPGAQTDGGEAAYRFQPELLALAKNPNAAVKATRQPGYAEDAYPFRNFHEHLHRCFDAFGPERMF